jgi:hypothetical protein
VIARAATPVLYEEEAMVLRFHRPRTRRARVLAVTGLVIIGIFSTTVVRTSAAHADASVYTLENTAEYYGPSMNPAGILQGAGSYISDDEGIFISCYVTGQSVSGPYGSEDVWDKVTGAPYNVVQTGGFVPDAIVYTGSSSPVVPRCPGVVGQIIGDVQVPVYENGPGFNNTLQGYVGPGADVVITCYSTGGQLTGPYGPEEIWDKTTRTSPAASQWVPDAYVYTGSNSAVVSHC